MNRKEFIDYTSERSGVPRYRLRTALDAIVDSIAAALTEGHPVSIYGFGEFTVKQRRGGIGRLSKTGETIVYPAKKKPHFKPGTLLINAVKEGADNWPDQDEEENPSND